MHAGETIEVRIRASHSAGKVVRQGSVVAEFWKPGRDPQADPEVRASPDRHAECVFEEKALAWVALVPTGGWEPGEWTVRGRVSGETGAGDAHGWGWQVIPLAA